MAKIDITKTELVWPGKYNDEGSLREAPPVSLPFQVIEAVNESRATREAQATRGLGLFEVYKGTEGDTFEDGWRNKLVWGDNQLVMSSLLGKFAGKVDLIYIDPPFATGSDFSFEAEIGDSGDELHKEQSAIEEKAYRDTWGRGLSSYADMMFSRLTLMRALLSETGSIYVHVGWQANSHVRLLLDEVFGGDNLRDEVIWHYETSSGASQRTFIKNHATLYHYSKTAQWVFNQIKEPWPETTLRKWQKDEEGRIYRIQNKFGKRYYIDPAGKAIDDVWEFTLASRSHERLGYPTQKPEALLEQVVKASSNEGSLVADFFCGSGTTLAVAEKLDRRWIGCDLGRWGVHVTRKRLLGIEGCQPFEVLNLGKYERQYWQSVTFGTGKSQVEISLYEYLAFILKLYGSQPVTGMAHLHGKKGRAMIHIGAVDAPVTIAEIDAAVDECVKLKQPELHVLGWEWEMGIDGLVTEAAKKRGVKLLLLRIPREVMEQQATAKGDVRFFELAYLEAEVEKFRKCTAQVRLQDFVIPDTELIPEEVRSKVKKWSDYIDYWAVDWDFRNDTFIQGWVAYRTRKDRRLPLSSDPHAYEKPGSYSVLVKAIDIFGNDTTRAFDVEVK